MFSPLPTRLRRLVLPVYDELTLFSLGYTCMLFLAGGLPSLLGDGFTWRANGAAPLLVLVVVGAGAGLSLFHAVSTRRKSRLEKQVMFLFAVILNGFSGIWGGAYLLSRAQGLDWFLVFPLANILSGWLLFVGTRNRQLDENCVDDRNVTIPEVILSILLITIAFALASFWQHFHWAATLSLCVLYGTRLNRVIVNLLLPHRPA